MVIGSEFLFIDMTSFVSSQIYPALKMAYFDWLNMTIISKKYIDHYMSFKNANPHVIIRCIFIEMCPR